jgi:tetratricopeptide (TPR) repeat protein
MGTLTQLISTYSYVDRPAIDFGTVDLANADIALLARVDSLLTEAAAAFSSRNYDAAISSYHAAESLIYTNLDPSWQPETGIKVRPLLPRDPSLFAPLLSATSQWLNVIPVPAALSPVRPTSAVSGSLLTSVSALEDARLGVVSANALAASESLADLRLAAIYNDQGNAAAGQTLATRAAGLDATLAGAVNPITATPSAPMSPPTPTAPITSVSGSPSAPVTAPTPTLPPTSPVLRPIEPIAAAATGEHAEIAEANPIASEAALPASELRLSGAALNSIALPTLPISALPSKQLGLVTGTAGAYQVQPLQWASSSAPDVSQLTNLLYTSHVSATSLPDALTNVSSIWERAATLPHDYFYVIPLALAQCYQGLGDYATAETYYLQAAAYPYLNTAVEGPFVWVALAGLYSVWGDSHYQQGDVADAVATYAKVLTATTTAPSTPLYTLAGLSVAAKAATALIPQLSTLVSSGVSGVSADDTAIASALLKIYAKLGQIGAGLDFWGNWADAIPIWPFSYLQQVASSFTQYALDAEQQVINFWAQADQATLTQTQLQNGAAEASAQVAVAQTQLTAAQDQSTVYQAGVTLAQTRASDAAANANEYQSTNSTAIVLDAEATQNNGGDSGDPDQVTSLAGQLLSGQTISSDDPTLAGSAQLAANMLSQQYQVDSMNRTATEMQQAVTQAQAQVTAANAQVAAAGAGLAAAALEANLASQTLSVFDADTFTPQVWRSMGDFMLQLYTRYMAMALGAARLMQQAYNFENDTSVTYIKSSYPGLLDGLLAADQLMADIQQFTYDLITAKRGKKQYVKTSISLATNYGYQFQSQLAATGEMTFETTLDDFDSAFPGSYGGRIQSVSVDVQGIVPPTGISGTLTNGGISFFRLPSDIATPTNPSKVRIQDSDTLVLSDYNPAVDPQLNSATGQQLGIFEGAGVASTWTLSLPKQLNNIDYGTLTDVVLTFLYETRYDPQLTSTVLADLASRTGFYGRQWAIPLAWLYPDLFYGFQQTGTMTLPLSASDFPLNQTAPSLTAVGLLVSTQSGTPSSGITLSLTAPGKSALTAVTAADGTISSQQPSSPWAAATGGTALGDWVITLPTASNPKLAPGGTLNLASLQNMVLVLDYSFTPRS